MYIKYISKHELDSLFHDKDRLKSQLSDRLHLNQLLARPINRTLLNKVRRYWMASLYHITELIGMVQSG